MENRIGLATASPTDTNQADEGLRRSRAADRDVRQMLARRAGVNLINGLQTMAEQVPSPHGPALRITVTVIGTGETLPPVDVDSVNIADLARIAANRPDTLRPQPARPARHLRAIGGGK
ncbi:hypothetical protein [Streptomyces sp. NPDC003395]